jgi:hypothetical protein
MNDHDTSDWSRKSELVLQSLQDCRLSADAALKGINELKYEFAVMKTDFDARLKKAEEETREIKSRLDRANQWLMGIVAGLVLFGLQQVVALLQQIPKSG